MITRSVVVSVSADPVHHFSKPVRSEIVLVAGQGIVDDAHAGVFVRHRYLARWHPRMPNDRQVHLIEAELFETVAAAGYRIGPGALGENVTTRGLDLCHLPLGTHLHLGSSAIIELRGLRTPCVLINRF